MPINSLILLTGSLTPPGHINAYYRRMLGRDMVRWPLLRLSQFALANRYPHEFQAASDNVSVIARAYSGTEADHLL